MRRGPVPETLCSDRVAAIKMPGATYQRLVRAAWRLTHELAAKGFGEGSRHELVVDDFQIVLEASPSPPRVTIVDARPLSGGAR